MLRRDINTELEREPISFPGKISGLMIIVAVSELVAKTERFYYPIFVLLLLIYHFHTRRAKLHADYTICILLFGLYSMFSVVWSPAQGAINGAFTKLVVLLFLVLQLQFDYSDCDYSFMKNMFIVQGILFAAVFFMFGVKDWDGRVWIRNGSLSVDPNSIAVWTLIPLCLSFEMLFKRSEALIKRIAGAVVIGLMVFIVLQGASRSGIVSITLTSCLCVAYGFKDSIRKNPFFALLIVIVAIIAGVYVLNHIPPAVIARFQYADFSSFGGRTTKWTNLIDMLKDNPLQMFVGFGESTAIYYTGMVAHNMYVETFFAQGLIGLFLLIIFMIGAFRNAIKTDPYTACAFVGVAIMSASLSEFTSRGVMLALFIAGARVIRSSNDDEIMEGQI